MERRLRIMDLNTHQPLDITAVQEFGATAREVAQYIEFTHTDAAGERIACAATFLKAPRPTHDVLGYRLTGASLLTVCVHFNSHDHVDVTAVRAADGTWSLGGISAYSYPVGNEHPCVQHWSNHATANRLLDELAAHRAQEGQVPAPHYAI